MAQNNKTSLEKSHSKSSNAKLTLLCLFSVLCFSALWVCLCFLKDDNIAYIIPACIASAILSFLCLLLFNKFKR